MLIHQKTWSTGLIQTIGGVAWLLLASTPSMAQTLAAAAPQSFPGEKYFEDWTMLQLPGDLYDRLSPTADINELIQAVSKAEPEGFGVPVLVFNEKPPKASVNPELKIQNPEALRSWVDYYSNPIQPNFVWAFTKDANAQTLPPYLYNDLVRERDRNRPGVDGFQIHLGSSSQRGTLLHEISHVAFQKIVFPDPVVHGEAKRHPYNEIARSEAKLLRSTEAKLAEVSRLRVGNNSEALYQGTIAFFQAYLRWANENFRKLAYPKIEEALLFRYNLDHTSRFNLSQDEKFHYLWLHVSMLLDLHASIDSVRKDPNYAGLVAEKAANRFDERLVADYDTLTKRLDKTEEQVKAGYRSILKSLLNNAGIPILAEMERQKRVRITSQNGTILNVEVIE